MSAQSDWIERIDHQVATLKVEVADLKTQAGEAERTTRALKKLALGQAATNALLAGLLVSKCVLSRDEAALMVVAGRDAEGHRDLTPEQIENWAAQQMRNVAIPGEARRKRERG